MREARVDPIAHVAAGLVSHAASACGQQVKWCKKVSLSRRANVRLSSLGSIQLVALGRKGVTNCSCFRLPCSVSRRTGDLRTRDEGSERAQVIHAMLLNFSPAWGHRKFSS